MQHANLKAASTAAVADGRLTAEQQTQLSEFVDDIQSKPVGAINWQNFLTNILPIIGLVFPQAGGIISIITTIFGFLKPTPTPTPMPTPTPFNWQQLIAIIQSLLNGGTLPVPGPSPLPTPRA